MSHEIKKDFENSFKGYHKDAPSHLRKESANLKKNVANKMKSAQGKKCKVDKCNGKAKVAGFCSDCFPL